MTNRRQAATRAVAVARHDQTRAGWAGLALGSSRWTLAAGGGGGARAAAAVPAAAEGSHRHHRQHAGRADAVRRLARDDAPRAVSEARPGDPQPRVQRRRSHHAPALEELRHAGRVAERARRSRSAATRRIASRAPTPRRTSSSRSSATTSRTPERQGSRRSRRQLASWITHTLAQKYNGQVRAARGALLSDRARGSRQSRSAGRQGRTTQRLALYTKAMAEVATRRQRHVRRSVHAEPPSSTPTSRRR